jgi:hypothetical protein
VFYPVCFASRVHRFDPGHVHQFILIAKDLLDSTLSQSLIFAPTVHELCKIGPI